jgi:hypothetical protein
MTTNITQNNTAQFVAEFVDITGNITVPSGAVLSITYPLPTTGITLTTTNITMGLINSFFTATWFSSVSALGAATWAITASGGSSATITGDLRIITP